MTGVLALILASMVSAEAESFCTLRQFRGLRPRHAIEFSLRATTDSLADRNRVDRDANATGHRARISWDTATVYGQVFQVDRVDESRMLFGRAIFAGSWSSGGSWGFSASG